MFGFPFSSYPMFPGGSYGYGMPAYGGFGGYGMPFYGGFGGYGQPSSPSQQPMPPQLSSPTAEATPSASAPLNQMFQPSTSMPTGQFPASPPIPGTIRSIVGGFQPNPVFPTMPQGRPQFHPFQPSPGRPDFQLLNFRRG